MSSGLIDVHAHLLPDFYVEQATAADHAHPGRMGAWPSWSVRAHLDLTDSRTTPHPRTSPGRRTRRPSGVGSNASCGRRRSLSQ
jgi:hypothetical protein